MEGVRYGLYIGIWDEYRDGVRHVCNDCHSLFARSSMVYLRIIQYVIYGVLLSLCREKKKHQHHSRKQERRRIFNARLNAGLFYFYLNIVT